MKNIILLGLLTLIIAIASCSRNETLIAPPSPANEVVRVDTFTYALDGIDTFTFVSNGVNIEGLIYLPEGYETNNDLPAIYLIDYQEQHFTVVTDEFAQLINAVREIPNFEALVVTLKILHNIDATPSAFQTYCDVFKDMASYVDSNYTENTSRTLIARGSEAGIVLMTFLNEDPEANVFNNYIATDSPSSFNSEIIELNQSGNVPENMPDKKLHVSYSSSNNSESCTALINSLQFR